MGLHLKHEMLTTVARVCHEVNRGYCESTGDRTQVPWEEATAWQKASAESGVLFHVEHWEATPEDSHDSWMAMKHADGWVWGPQKDPERKRHPCMVPYKELAWPQRTKDYLFRAVVHAMISPEQADAIREWAAQRVEDFTNGEAKSLTIPREPRA